MYSNVETTKFLHILHHSEGRIPLLRVNRRHKIFHQFFTADFLTARSFCITAANVDCVAYKYNKMWTDDGQQN